MRETRRNRVGPRKSELRIGSYAKNSNLHDEAKNTTPWIFDLEYLWHNGRHISCL